MQRTGGAGHLLPRCSVPDLCPGEAGRGPSQAGTVPGHDSISNSPAVALLEKKGQGTLSQKHSRAPGNNCYSGIFNCSHRLGEKLGHCHSHHPSLCCQGATAASSSLVFLVPMVVTLPQTQACGHRAPPLMEKDEATGPHYLIHFSLHQRPSAVLPQTALTNSKTRNKTIREGGSLQKVGS